MPKDLLIEYYKNTKSYDYAFDLIKSEADSEIIATLSNFALSLPSLDLKTQFLKKILFEECLTHEETLNFMESNSEILSPYFDEIIQNLPEISSTNLIRLKKS